jgi:dTMP kinase
MASPIRRLLRRFIVLEGGDGAGTTTQLRLIGEALARAGVPHWTTSEPSDFPEGQLIRRILSGELRRDPGTLARLFAADRNEHLLRPDGILDRLRRGETVVCDRYVPSSLAYQGVACGRELPEELNAAFPLPELIVFFDLPPEQSLGRLGDRERLDIFEELPFQEKVRLAYREALAGFAAAGTAVRSVDASRSVSEVNSDILRAIGDILGLPLSADTR